MLGGLRHHLAAYRAARLGGLEWLLELVDGGAQVGGGLRRHAGTPLKARCQAW